MPFLIWGTLLLTYRILHYGLASGFYLWFDHFFLILSGVFILKKARRFQVALTYLVLIVGGLWASDNLYYLISRRIVSGVTSFLAQPGLSWFEFLLLQSHLILGPLLLLILPEEETRKPITGKILIFPLLVFLASYFTPYAFDLNCIHTSCTPFSIPLPHWLKSTVFAILSSLLLYVISEGLRKITLTYEQYRKPAAKILTALGALITLWNIYTFYQLPKFSCESFENTDAKISCEYTTDSSQDYFRLHYSILIKAKTRKECTPYLILDESKEPMEQPMLLPPKDKNEFSILVPFPKKDTLGKLEIECHDFTY